VADLGLGVADVHGGMQSFVSEQNEKQLKSMCSRKNGRQFIEFGNANKRSKVMEAALRKSRLWFGVKEQHAEGGEKSVSNMDCMTRSTKMVVVTILGLILVDVKTLKLGRVASQERKGGSHSTIVIRTLPLGLIGRLMDTRAVNETCRTHVPFTRRLQVILHVCHGAEL
jgi:hypothetical protein